MLPLDYCILCGAIQNTFIFITQGVQTLTREDRDINGWLHFLRCIIFHRAVNRSCARHVQGFCKMIDIKLFENEARRIIALLPKEFKSHQFYTMYTMSYPLSYLDWLKEYSDVKMAHIQISNALLRLSKEGKLAIKHIDDVSGRNIFGNDNTISQWTRTDKESNTL